MLGYGKAEFQETLAAVAGHHFDARLMIIDVLDPDAVPAMFDALAAPNTRRKVMIEFRLKEAAGSGKAPGSA